MMLILCGIPGSGKTTIAKELSRRISGEVMHVETDKIRFMIPSPTYSKEESELVYEIMFSTAAASLARGYTVILDATFPREEYRKQAKSVARAQATPCLVVYVECSRKEALERNRLRKARGRIAPKVIDRIASYFEEPGDALRIDSESLSPRRSAALILSHLKTA